MRSSLQTNETTHQNPGALWQKGLQVSGQQCFPENLWRQAILHYLFGIWGNREEVTHRPKINFGGITLRLDPSQGAEGTYYAYGTSEEKGPWSDLEISDGELSVSYRQLEVENGLIRFVKDDSIRTLFVHFENGGRLCLWKKRQRSRFGIDCRGIPTIDCGGIPTAKEHLGIG